jgi:hypothetical protein
MKILRPFFTWLDIFFMPRRSYPVSQPLTNLINLYLNQGFKPQLYSEFGVEFVLLGDLWLWWSIFPFASGSIYLIGYGVTLPDYEFKRELNRLLWNMGYNTKLPTRATVWRLYLLLLDSNA